MKSATVRKALILGAIIFCVLFIIHFPTWYALINTPTGYAFTGNNAWFDPWDINVYVAAIKWGQQGHFLLKNLHTTDELRPALMYPLYTSVGLMFRWVNPYILFTIIAVVIGLALCLSNYLLSRYFFAESFLKRAVFLLLVSLGGGLSWLINWNLIPDAWFTSFTYHSLFQRGHEGLGVLAHTAFFILVFVSITKGFSAKKTVVLFASYILALLTYPYMYVHFAVSSVLFFWVFPDVRTKKTYALITALLFVGVIEIGWYFWHLQQSGFGSLVTQRLSNANPLQLILGYGLFLITFLYALLYRHNHRWVRFFIVWIVVGWVLSFIPIGVARFFLRGLYFPMAALAIYAIEDISSRYKIKKQAIYILYIAIGLLTTITIFHMRVKNVDVTNGWTYMPIKESDAVSFLQTQKDARILASYYISNHIPAILGTPVYFGHVIQTPQAEKRSDWVDAFYSGKWNNKKARDFLLTNHITHVYYGAVEKMLGTMPPYPFLKSIYQKGGVTIYRVS